MRQTVERRMTPDGDLVARMVARDEAALEELWARHSRTAYAVAIGILRESARADLAVSEAFHEAFSAANHFVPGELTVLAWLTRLTRRHAEALMVKTA